MPATRTTSLSLSSPTSPSSRKPRSRPTQRQSLEDSRERTERTKRGCWTCRIRRKKCDEMVIDATCRTCSRLRIDCLGWGPKRPEWMKNKEAVDQKKAEIKKQLATQGMIRGQVKALNRAAAAAQAAAQAAASQNSSTNSSLAHSPNGGEEEETASSSSRLMMIPSLPAFDPSSEVPLRTLHPRASKQAAVGAIRIQTHPPSEDEDDEDIIFGSHNKSSEYDSLLQFQGGAKDREASPLSAMSTTSSSDETDLTPLTMAGDEAKDYLNMFGPHHSTSLPDELKSSSTVSPSFSNSPLPQAPSIFGLADPDSQLNVYNSGLNEFTVTSLDRSRPSSGLGTYNTILDMRQIQPSLDAPVNYMSGPLSARPHPEYADPLVSDSGLKGPRPSAQQGPQGQHLSRNRQASTSTTTTAISSGSPVIDLNNFMKDQYFMPGAPGTELSTITPGWLVASPSQIEQDISISHFASSKSPIPVSKPTVMADIQATHLFSRQSSAAGLAATTPLPLSIHTQPHHFTASAFTGQVTPTSAFNSMDQSAAALAASLLMNTPTSAEAAANQNLFQFAQSAGLSAGYPDPLASVSSFGPAAATAASMFSFNTSAAPSASSGSSVLSPQSETLLYYYFNRGVRRMQYLLADDNTTNVTDIMYNLVMSDPNGPVTNAICALSSLYDTRVCISNGSILHDDRGAHDNARKYYALTVKQLQEKSGKYTEVEAIASLHLLSFWLFCGGGGDWASALGIASEWLAKSDIVTKMDRVDPLTALESATPAVRFAAQGTMWMDIFGAVSQRREPRFMTLYRRLRNSAKSRSMNSSPFGPAQPTKSQFLYNVMGCEDDVMFLIAEIAELAAWKEEQIERGTLSMKDLIKRGCLIEEALTSLESTRPERPSMSRGSAAPRQTSDPSWMLTSTDDLGSSVFSDFGASSTSSPGSTSSQTPTLTQLASNVFRETATLYLNTVLSGCQPRVSEISQSVRNVVDAIRKIPSSDLDRSLIFPLTLAGCLADKPADREFFKDRLATQGSTVGNGHRAKALMEAVWKQRDAKKWNRSNDVVCWREMMVELNFHLLLV